MTLFDFHVPALFHHSAAQAVAACMFRAVFYTVRISSFSTFYGPACYRHAVSHAFLGSSSGSLMMLSWILHTIERYICCFVDDISTTWLQSRCGLVSLEISTAHIFHCSSDRPNSI